jgi:2-aminoethylphosphonate-pyruvate transaminase
MATSASLSLEPRTHPKFNGLPTHYDPTKSQQDKLLFTPGPLTTSFPVKQAATRDLGSRDVAFQQVIKDVRQGLLDVAGVSPDEYTTVPVQGSGTFAIESVLCSVVDKKKGVLVIANGAYGLRQTAITKAHKIPTILYECADYEAPSLEAIEKLLQTTAKDVSHVSVVHSETTSGIVNDVETIGVLAKKYNKKLIIDAMSSFGAYPLDFKKGGIDYLISSANKCIEGVPGFAFAICRKSALEEAKGNSSSLALDLYAQNAGLDANGQFRFTPPTHPLIAFGQALKELQIEGGVAARGRRYKTNQTTLMAGLGKLGFELYLPKERQGYIISSYRWPTDSAWNFDAFYSKLNSRGFVIYPGKVSNADCFRIGHIGRIFPEDTENLVQAITEVCKEMKTAAFAKGAKAKL